MIKKLFQFNVWANKLIADVIDPAKADLETPSSFTSIRKTILHMWDAEMIWLERLKGNTPENWPSQSFKGTAEDVLHGWIEHCSKFEGYVSALSEEQLSQKITYKNMHGDEFTQPVSEILYHVANHGTYHRGQLVTMIRALGFDEKMPQTDLIVFLRDSVN